MMRLRKRFFVIVLWLLYHVQGFAHDIKVSYAELNFEKDLITIDLHFFSEDLQHSLIYFAKKNIRVHEHSDNKFTNDLVLPLKEYIKENLQIVANNRSMLLEICQIKWKENTFFSDNPVLTVRLSFSYKERHLKSIKIKNSLLMIIPDQTNILHFNEKGKTQQTFSFTKGKEYIEINK